MRDTLPHHWGGGGGGGGGGGHAGGVGVGVGRAQGLQPCPLFNLFSSEYPGTSSADWSS